MKFDLRIATKGKVFFFLLLKSLQELGMGDDVAVFQILKGNHIFQPKFLHTRP